MKYAVLAALFMASPYRLSASGVSYKDDPVSIGDNLGNHTAIQNLNMNSNSITQASSITVGALSITGGSVSINGLTSVISINSVPMFSVSGSTGFLVVRSTQGAIDPNTTITIPKAPLGLSAIVGAVCGEVEGTNAAVVSTRLKNTLGNSSVQVYNASAVAAQIYSCLIWGNP